LIKRIIDIVVSSVLIFLLSPLLVVIAVLVKFSSPGPALFRPIRVGRDGEPFKMNKFRTMRVGGEKDWMQRFDPENIDEFVFQSEDDPRITKVGGFLRRTSLDELPNFFNTFGGSMSLVGPRPEEPEVVAHYSPKMRGRLTVKPGITGLAQVSGRGELPLADTIGYDLDYVKDRTLWMDLKLLIQTPLTIFSRRGAL